MTMMLALLLACSLYHAAAPGRTWSATLPKKQPVTVTADKLDYDRTRDRYVASGHVKIEQEGVRIEADEVVLDNSTGEVTADGKVIVQEGGNVIKGDTVQVNLITRAGTVAHGDFFIKKDNLHLRGEKVDRLSESVYHVEKGIVTSCNEDEWYLEADTMDIDMNRYATATGVTFNAGGIPVMYTPYFLFPVRRQTGFLIPEIGYSSRDGFFADNAFFWAISDHRDATIYSDYRAHTGHGTGVEYRYANSQESRGEAFVKWWDLYHTGVSRWEARFQHKEEFAEDLSGRVDINLVSDEHYYYDLDRKLESRSRPYLDSNAFYVERWQTASLHLMGQYSTDLTRTNEHTVQKLPELRYTLFDETIAGPVHLSFESSAVNFSRQSGDGARRIDFNPRLTMPFGSSGLSITPKAGVRATFYDRSANAAEPSERKFFYAGMDLNARVSRIFGSDGEAGIGRIRHSIEPTVSYNHIPHVEQSSIPQFDSLDLLSAQNLVTVALINRLTAHYKDSKEVKNYSTFDIMVFRLSQTYDLNLARDRTADSPRPASELLGELFLRTPSAFTLTANGSYNTYGHVLSSHSEGAVMNLSPVSLNVSRQFLREPRTEFLIGGGSVKIGPWLVSAQWWHDVVTSQTTQEDYRLHYGSQCWGIGFSYIVKPGQYEFMATLDLKGLGGRAYGK